MIGIINLPRCRSILVSNKIETCRGVITLKNQVENSKGYAANGSRIQMRHNVTEEVSGTHGSSEEIG